MPSTPPDGFLTRPEAARQFNRSQRALERDLDLALSMQDEDVLHHWRLVTKDGEVRPAMDVGTEEAKKLVADGMAPFWCVAEDWLKREYGQKGEPKPPKQREQVSVRPESRTETENEHFSTSASESALQRELAFLQDRVRGLERDRKEEIERSEAREAKLFEQLAVKDRQISAWDEITQGLARGLATGQIIPSLLPVSPPHETPSAVAKENEQQPVTESSVVESAPAQPKRPSRSRKKPNASKRKPKQTKPKQNEKARSQPKQKLANSSAKTTPKKKPGKKPTSLERFAASLFRRS